MSSWVILKRYVHVNYGHSSSLNGTWHKLLENKDMSVEHVIGRSITQ